MTQVNSSDGEERLALIARPMGPDELMPLPPRAVQALRARIAKEIAAQQVPCPEPGHQFAPAPSCWQCGRNGAFHRAARIAAGTHRG